MTAWLARCVALLAPFLVLFCPLAAQADTVASLLGNFTINQYCELDLEPAAVKVHFVVIFGQLPALRELHLADANGDGVTTQEERDAYVATLAPGFARDLALTVDGAAVPLTAARWQTSLPTEQGGFSMRLDIDYAAPLPVAIGTTPRDVRFDNRNFAGRLGWHEIAVLAAPPLRLFDTNAFDDSLTNGLKDALQTLPASGPLDERAVHLQAVAGPLPDGATPIGARGHSIVATKSRAGPSRDASVATSDAGAAEWLARQTRRLVEMISAPTVAPSVMLLALLAAMILGALHAFSPGHGKTIVGAYLIGSRSTPRHAIFLGLTVTITHTLVVFAVGLATLFASRYILPEHLFPILSLLSGVLVLGMGVVLFRQRWPAAHEALARLLLGWYERKAARTESAARQPLRSLRPLPAAAAIGMTRATAGHRHPHGARVPGAGGNHVVAHVHADGHGHDHSHGHAHDHGHAHAHAHDHDHNDEHVHGDGMHSHGGRMHSHLPPGASGEKVSWRSLLALGVSGGLVPCPSAMVLLLAAVALNKTAYGLLMVVAFSVGLAVTLIAVGMVFLYARNRFSGRMGASNVAQMLPALSGAFITLIGLVLCYGALTSVSLAAFRAT